MSFDYACIVVGAGIEGLSTATKLAERGKSVLLLEQFPLFHTRGSTSGLTRITRLAYKKPEYVKLAQQAHKEWKRLESDFGTQLYRNTGILVVGPTDHSVFQDYEYAMKQSGVECKHLTREELEQSYGALFKVPENRRGFWEPEGGLLYANRCLQAYRKKFLETGGKLIDKCPVVDIHPGKIVRVTSEDGSNFRAKSVVLTMGPWTPKFLKEKLGLSVPVQVLRTFACYWKENRKGQYSADNGVPAVLFPEKDGAYFFKPTDEYPGLLYYGLHTGVPCDPDNPAQVDMTTYLKKSQQMAEKIQLNIQTDAPAVVEPCFYQESIDGDYILDSHPQYNNIVFGTGFSGHGFKMAPVVGDILANLALGYKSGQYPYEMFSLKRFNKSKF